MTPMKTKIEKLIFHKLCCCLRKINVNTKVNMGFENITALASPIGALLTAKYVVKMMEELIKP